MKSKTKIINFIVSWSCLFITISTTGVAAEQTPGEIVYKREGVTEEAAASLAFPPSVFPHWIHRINYRCDACHEDLFEMKIGGTLVTMDLIKKGEVCGACHNGLQAFEVNLSTCNKCHRSDLE